MSFKSKARIFWFFIFLCFLMSSCLCLYSLWLNQKNSKQIIDVSYSSQRILDDLKLNLNLLHNNIINYKKYGHSEALEKYQTNHEKVLSLLSDLKMSRASSDQKAVGELIALALNNSEKDLNKTSTPSPKENILDASHKIEIFINERHLRSYYQIKFSEVKKIQEDFLRERKQTSLESINGILKEMDEGLQKLSKDSYLVISDLFESYKTFLYDYLSPKTELGTQNLEIVNALKSLDELIEKSKIQLISHFYELQAEQTERFYFAAALGGITLFFLLLKYLLSMRMISFFNFSSKTLKEKIDDLNISITGAKTSFNELDELTLRQGNILNETTAAIQKIEADLEEKNEKIARSIDLVNESSRNFKLAKTAFEKINKAMTLVSRESAQFKGELSQESTKCIEEGIYYSSECEGVFASMSEKGDLVVTGLEEILYSLKEETHRLQAMTLAINELDNTNNKATEFCELCMKEMKTVKSSVDTLLTLSHKLGRKASGK